MMQISLFYRSDSVFGAKKSAILLKQKKAKDFSTMFVIDKNKFKELGNFQLWNTYFCA